MYRLQNGTQHYAWGSPDAIPRFLGEAAGDGPVAEVWMGTHPILPSTAVDEAGRTRPLRDVAGDLPFMAKLLAAAQPLSLQVHPALSQAVPGYASEQAAGVPLDAPERRFKDANHKPEIVYALTPFQSLLGFRDVAETTEILRSVGSSLTDSLCRRLSAADRDGADAISTGLSWLLSTAQDAAEIAWVVEACRSKVARGDDAWGACATVAELARTYPDDIGLVVSLMLNRVALEPGEAAFIPAGSIHAHLEGLCLEVMASSDNVLRAGLTSKHVDRLGLIESLDTTPGADLRMAPSHLGDVVELFDPPDVEISLAVVDLSGGDARVIAPSPAVLLCIDGTVEVAVSAGDPLVLRRGQSAVVDQDDGPLLLSGPGTAAWTGSEALLLAV